MQRRKELQYALVLNAATKPLNVFVVTGLIVAALLLDVAWLFAVAIVCWLALFVITFFDEREAVRVGERARAARRALAPKLAAPALTRRWEAVLAARAAIARDSSPLLPEADSLVDALRPTFAQLQRIHDALATGPKAGRERLQARYEHLLDELDQAVATLETVHAELLVNDGLEHDELVAELRARLTGA
jgi:hypothetical protein